MKLCSCGRPKFSRSARCLACAKAVRRRALTCTYCGVAFWRRKVGDKEQRRFCSRECYFSMKKAHAVTHAAELQASKANEQIEKVIQRELREAAQQTLLVLRWCPCGAPLNRRSVGGRYCRACVATRIRTATRNARHAASEQGIEHLCPNCGQWFKGYEREVYCSVRCGKRMRKVPGRYPSISEIPIDQRNQLAEYLALIRRARRHIDSPQTASP